MANNIWDHSLKIISKKDAMKKILPIDEVIHVKIKLTSKFHHYRTSKILHNLLQSYSNDIIQDLDLPVSVAINIKEMKYPTELDSTNNISIFINNHQCRLPVPYFLDDNISVEELAREITSRIIENRELLVTNSLTKKLQYNWSIKYRKDFLMQIPNSSFTTFIILFVLHRFSIKWAEEFISKISGKKRVYSWNSKTLFEKATCNKDLIKLFLFLNKKQSYWIEKSASKISDVHWSTATTVKSQKTHKTKSRTEKMAISPRSKINKKLFTNLLFLMNDSIYYEWGLLLPIVKVSIDEKLEDPYFRIQLNDLRSAPIKGIKIDQFIVNETPGRLCPLNINGEPIKNPKYNVDMTVVDNIANYSQICKNAGLILWDSPNFIMNTFIANVMKNAEYLLTSDIVRDIIRQYIEPLFPDLVDIASKRWGIVFITEIFRELLKEKIRIKDLNLILEHIATIDEMLVKKQNTHEEKIESVVNFLRQKLSPILLKGVDKLIVMLLDKNITEKFRSSKELSIEEHNDFIKSVYFSLGNVSGNKSVILTPKDIRKKVKNHISKEFMIDVYSFDEITPNLNIMPIFEIKGSL